MTPLRLHGQCPTCGRAEPLRPDGTLAQHLAPRSQYTFHASRCGGAGQQPVAGSAEAWLSEQERAAATNVERAAKAIADAREWHAKATTEARVLAAWATKERARRSRKGQG